MAEDAQSPTLAGATRRSGTGEALTAEELATIDGLETGVHPARHGTASRIANPLDRGGAGLLRVRWFVRAPIWVFRARLGAIFGGRLLMLEHRGRRTGQPRLVVLEIVDRPRDDTWVVVSGFGRRAQWYRNVEADPHVRVWLGSRGPVAAEARVLPAEEGAAALRRYEEEHPRAWASLRPVLEQTLGARIDEAGTELPMVALRHTA